MEIILILNKKRKFDPCQAHIKFKGALIQIDSHLLNSGPPQSISDLLNTPRCYTCPFIPCVKKYST